MKTREFFKQIWFVSADMRIRIAGLLMLLAIVWVPTVGQNRLVPSVSIFAGSGRHDDTYVSTLKEYLLHDHIGDSGSYPSFIYMSLPSFTSEYALTSTDDGNVLTLTQAKEDLWGHFYDKIESKSKIKYSPELVTSYQLQVPDSVLDILQMLVKSAIETSSYLFEKRGFDGITYHFESSGNAAECWTPNGRCGELVKIFDQCCRAVMNNDVDSIIKLMPQCREMTVSFRMDYPSDLFEVQHRMVKEEKGLVDLANELNNHYHYFLLLESYHVMMVWDGEDEATLQELCDEFKKKHGEDMMEFSRQLTCTHFVDERVCLHPEDFVDKDFNDLYQEFLTDKNRFLKEHKFNGFDETQASLNPKHTMAQDILVIAAYIVVPILAILIAAYYLGWRGRKHRSKTELHRRR